MRNYEYHVGKTRLFSIKVTRVEESVPVEGDIL